jgi:hypothetical protein
LDKLAAQYDVEDAPALQVCGMERVLAEKGCLFYGETAGEIKTSPSGDDDYPSHD